MKLIDSCLIIFLALFGSAGMIIGMFSKEYYYLGLGILAIISGFLHLLAMRK